MEDMIMPTRDDSKGFYEFTKLMNERRERKIEEKKAARSGGSGKSDKITGLTFQKHLNARIS